MRSLLVYIIRILKAPVPLHGSTNHLFTYVAACLLLSSPVFTHALKNEVYACVAFLLRSAQFVTN